MLNERNRISNKIYQSNYSSNETANNYFEWLCSIIDVNMEDRTYWFLAGTLHKKEYYWSVPNDDNREVDGLRLRDEFDIVSDERFDLRDLHSQPCTMLEVLIGLARRMADLTAELCDPDHTREWFWVIIRNLDLEKFTDDEYFDYGGTPRVNFLLDQVLGRTFKRSGKGGLFPLKYPKKDQRKVEIWYQMCAYLLEGYYVDGRIG